MASEVISHAIFAFSHPPPRPHRLVFHSASHSALRTTSHPALHSASRLSCTPHPALHSSPYSAQPCTPTLHPIMRFPQHLDPHSHPYPSANSLLPPAHPFPIRVSPFLSVPQPSPFTPYFTPHPIMPFTLRTDPIPHHPFPSHFFAPQDSFIQVPPSTSLHLPPVRQFPIRVSHPPCPSAKPRLRIFSCVKRPGSLTT